MVIQSAQDALPINMLDYCTTPTQLNAVLAGDVGIDIPMNLALADALIAGRPVFIPGRHPNTGRTFEYVTTTNATIVNPGVTIFGNDATIRKVGYGPLFSTKAIDPVMSNGNLLSNATKGAQSVTLASGQVAAAGLAVGDWIVITDRTRIYSSANSYRAEFQLIQAINGDVVTFWGPLVYSYTAGTGGGAYARLVKAPFISNVGYRDLNIIMDNSDANRAYDDNHAFDNSWLYNASFQNIRIDNLLNAGLRFQNCLNCSASDIDLNMGGSDTTGYTDPESGDPDPTLEGRPGFSYGVCEAGLNLGLKVSAVTASNLRHLYTTTSLKAGDGDPADYGEPIGAIISDCLHSHPINAGFDTHEAGQNITFQDCKVVGGHFVGIQVRALGTTVRNFEAHDTIGAAVWIRGGQSNNAYADLTVIDGVLANRTNLGTSWDGIVWQDKGAVIDEAPRSRISNVHARFVGGPALDMYRNAPFNGGKYSAIDALDVCQLTTNTKGVIILRNLASSGLLDIDGVTSASSDGKVTDIVKIQTSNGTVRLRNIEGSGHSGKKINSVSPDVVDFDLRVERYDSSTQYVRHYSNSSGHFIQSYSLSAAAPKSFVIDVNTDEAQTPPTGDIKFFAQVNGVKGVGSDQNGCILQQDNIIFDANRLPVVRSYPVASLPTGVAVGTLAFASNGRAFNGAGTLEGAGAGTGVLVNRTTTAWKVVGTNQTVSA